MELKAPFPYFGGKSKVAHKVWQRFGNVVNYVEPFFGSGAVMLARPSQMNGITETVNDANAYLANFWRAVKNNSDSVAAWADYPVSEVDLVARHRWLIDQTEFVERMKSDPDYYDCKIAGWWVWGMCSWIGGGFCVKTANKLPHLGDAGRGINRKLPHLGDAGRGINRKLPHLGNAGRGINRKLPHLSPGMGINRKLQLPHLGDAGRGEHIKQYFNDIAVRFRDVRIACGDWPRVLGDSVTHGYGLTAIFLDPPYDADCSMPYAAECKSSDVAAWAIENGDNPLLRIALCGYEGEHDIPDSWECYAWKTQGGYGLRSDGQGRENSSRERIWFSPHCVKKAAQIDLFAA